MASSSSVTSCRGCSRRRVELDRRSNSFVTHAETWAYQKNVLNQWITKFTDRDRNCNDDDLPPGSPMKGIEFESRAPALAK